MSILFKNRIHSIVLAAVTLLILQLSSSVFANVSLPNGEFHETYDDLVVKVIGGHVKVKRTYYDGKWHFNRAWAPLQFERNISTDEMTAVRRNSRTFEITEGASRFVFDERNSISTIATGYRWEDRKGNWIEYDQNGRVSRYGDRNNVQVSFQYDTFGRRSGVFDHFGTQVVWYEYDGDTNRLLAVRDHADIAQARRAQYQYTGEQLTTVIDVLENPWVYTYVNNKLSTIVDPESRITNVAYHPNNRVKSVTKADGTGVFYEYSYDKTRKEFFVRSSLSGGRIEEYWFDGNSYLIRHDSNGVTLKTVQIDGRTRISTNELGHKTIREYDEWGSLLKTTHPDQTYATYKYDPVYTNLLEIVDERGIVTRQIFDDNGNITRKIDAEGTQEQRVTHYTPDQYGNVLSVRREADSETEESLTTYTYDNLGNLDTETIRVSANESHVTDYLSYDRMGNLRQWRDARTNLWQDEYDAKGQLILSTDPLNHTIRYEYDGTGNRRFIRNHLNHEQEFVYDLNNRLIQVNDAEGQSWDYEYNSNGQRVAIRDPLDRLILGFDYDTNGRFSKITDGQGNAVQLEYGIDSSDNVRYHGISSVIFTNVSFEFKYDQRGRLTQKIRHIAGVPSSIYEAAYDGVGNVVLVIDEVQNSQRYNYDALDRVTSVETIAGTTVIYDYDNRDNVISVTNEKLINIRRYQYDQKDRLTHEIWIGGEQFAFGYDANDNLELVSDGKGQITKYAHDSANRYAVETFYVDRSAYDANSPSKTVNYDYDDIDRLTSYDDGVTSAIYTYDNEDRILTESIVLPDSININLGYTYFSNGKRQTFTGPDNITNSYVYDNENRLSAITLPGEGHITLNQYELFRPKEITFPGGSKQVLELDKLNRVLGIKSLDGASNILENTQFELDNVNDILTKQTGQGTYTFGYDARKRLTNINHPAASDEQFSYDPAGNRITQNGIAGDWQYNDKNQLLSYGQVEHGYDNNGSLTSKRIGSVLVQQFEYDLNNRLSVVKDGSDQVVASYYYDPFGRRLWKEVGGIRTYFVYNEEGLVAEIDATGGVIKSYGFIPGTGWGTAPLFTRTDSGYAYYHVDQIGTPQMLVDKTGTIIWKGQQQAFGYTQEEVGAGLSNLRFPGQYYDAETGLHYNFNRYYDPSTGRYITSDPIDTDGGLNTYLYAASSPLIYFDNEGELINFITAGIGALIGGACAAFECYVIEDNGENCGCKIASGALSGALTGFGAIAAGAVGDEICDGKECDTFLDDVEQGAGNIGKGGAGGVAGEAASAKHDKKAAKHKKKADKAGKKAEKHKRKGKKKKAKKKRKKQNKHQRKANKHKVNGATKGGAVGCLVGLAFAGVDKLTGGDDDGEDGPGPDGDLPGDFDIPLPL